MTSNLFKCGALLVAFIAPNTACLAANGIGGFTGTSNPEVVTPPLIGPTPTPSYLSPPIIPTIQYPASRIAPVPMSAPPAVTRVRPHG